MNTVLSLLQIAHTSSVAHPPSYLMATRDFFSGEVKWQKREADYSCLSRANVKNN